MRIPLLGVSLALVASLAGADEPFSGSADFRGLVLRMRGISGRLSSSPPPPLAVRGGRDRWVGQDARVQMAFPEPCRRGEQCRPPRKSGEVTPVNAGFKALGPAGKTGKVDGPGRQGNGKYHVQLSDPYELQLSIATGYIRGQFTLKRDPQTGSDTMRFVGQLWDQGKGKWGPHQDSTTPASIPYDARGDRGHIRYKDGDSWVQEGYWDGREGRRSMTIEFGGGWDHDFFQD